MNNKMNELSLKEKACKSLLANVLDMDDDLRWGKDMNYDNVNKLRRNASKVKHNAKIYMILPGPHFPRAFMGEQGKALWCSSLTTMHQFTPNAFSLKTIFHMIFIVCMHTPTICYLLSSTDVIRQISMGNGTFVKMNGFNPNEASSTHHSLDQLNQISNKTPPAHLPRYGPTSIPHSTYKTIQKLPLTWNRSS